ncbi:TRAP transporter large permease [Rhodococcus sp. B50]|uniref:TRAP transporter large permease n=1 Tax=Rhodococcus sp. B50 TaxID=2682847 RepID=UPI001BD532B8|nr:TRAP transporter large permease subunit [Rhodococcus sp. B50]MBS9376090.1 C4-dicarboxylate TRAP transporter large permease protein DctM [Rhodococcus sp. B50]
MTDSSPTLEVPKSVEAEPRSGNRPQGSWLVRFLAASLIIGVTALMFGPFESEVVGGCAIVLMLVLMFLKVPIAVAMVTASVIGLYAVRGPMPVESLLSSLPYQEVSSWELSAIPMYVLMGLLLWKSRLTEKLYDAGRQWLSWLPGGLAFSTNAAGTGLAAISGSTIGSTYALARVGIPEMLKSGYNKRYTLGAVAVASLPGQLIPPSLYLIIFAGIAQVPVGPQLIAGVLPGLVVAACFGTTIVALAVARPALAGGHDRPPLLPWSGRIITLLKVWPVPVLIGLVLGGMFSGVVTATEAGAAGALGALLLTLWYRRKDHPARAISSAATETVATAGVIFLLTVGVYAFSRLLAISGIGPAFTNWVTELGFDRVQFLLVLMVAYLVMGMFMDPLSMMLLTVPLILPTLPALDISALWFGVFVVFMAELSVLTPPVGMLSFVLHKLVQDPEVNQGQSISLGDVFRGVAWFMPVAIVVCLILLFFPEIATYLPDRMGT